eukprot:18165-Heterococcus_DN1.PRE.2
MASDHISASNPLSGSAMIQQVFSFLPPGNWLFLGAVCREWQAVYAEQPDRQVYSFSTYPYPTLVTCCSKTTLYSAAVASPAMARLAQSCGLAICKNYELHAIAGRYANLDTLATLRELGMPLSDTVIGAVIVSGRLDVLQHVITQGSCSVLACSNLSYYAGRSSSINVLKWAGLQERWDRDDEHDACAGAAEG